MPLAAYDEVQENRAKLEAKAGRDRASEDPAEQAVAAIQAGGDPEVGFRTIVDCYFHPIRGFFSKRVFSAEDCLELTQETFFSIYKGLNGFRHEARFRSWAFAIAHTTYLKWLKRRKRRDELGEGIAADRDTLSETAFDNAELIAVDEHTPLQDTLRKEARHKLAEAIGELPEQERRCVVSRVYHDMTYQEIAQVLGLKVGTVKAHLHHARQKLRSTLRDSLGGIDF